MQKRTYEFWVVWVEREVFVCRVKHQRGIDVDFYVVYGLANIEGSISTHKPEPSSTGTQTFPTASSAAFPFLTRSLTTPCTCTTLSNGVPISRSPTDSAPRESLALTTSCTVPKLSRRVKNDSEAFAFRLETSQPAIVTGLERSERSRWTVS